MSFAFEAKYMCTDPRITVYSLLILCLRKAKKIDEYNVKCKSKLSNFIYVLAVYA